MLFLGPLEDFLECDVVGEKDGMRGWTRAHPSLTRFFMMVSFPEEAAFTICCSTDLLILALRLCHGTQQVSTAPHRYTRRTCNREERGVRETRRRPCA